MTDRNLVTFRLGSAPLAQIDQIARDTASTRTDVLRMALRIALSDPDNLTKRLNAPSARY